MVLAILVLFPLGALWLAGRWRDPPPERWGAPEPRQQAAVALELAEYRIRREFGVRDEVLWKEIRRAVDKGEAAPPALRPAAHRYARAVADDIDAQLAGRRRPPGWVVALGLVVAVAGLAYLAVHNPATVAIYLLYGTGLGLSRSRWMLSRRRQRAAAAAAANS